MYQMLRRHLLRHGVRIEIGFWVRGRIDERRAMGIEVDSAGQPTTYTADAYILATGGTGGGGISTERDGTLRETVFGLAVDGPRTRRASWASRRFLGPESQPISLAGVRVNEHLQPFAATGDVIENVFVVGSNLPGWDPVREGDGEGVALATGHRAAMEVLRVVSGESIASR
jgi:glycerol-3-phosphate dehydrogenase subunit B